MHSQTSTPQSQSAAPHSETKVKVDATMAEVMQTLGGVTIVTSTDATLCQSVKIQMHVQIPQNNPRLREFSKSSLLQSCDGACHHGGTKHGE